MLNTTKLLEPARIYTAICMLIATLFVVIFHSHILLWSVFGIVFCIAFYEAFKLYDRTTPNMFFWGLVILTWISVYFYESPMGVFVVLVILAGYQGYTKQGKLEQMMPFIYPTIPFVFFYLLYLDYSINAIIWLLFIVGLTDSFAYIGGKMLGGKLFTNGVFSPTSPNKTKEGVLVGVGIATLVGTLIGLGVCSFFTSFILTILASIASVFGDLYESFLKRQAEVKDSGSLFPGHGGVLDRLDGYCFAVIILYALLGIVKL